MFCKLYLLESALQYPCMMEKPVSYSTLLYESFLMHLGVDVRVNVM